MARLLSARLRKATAARWDGGAGAFGHFTIEVGLLNTPGAQLAPAGNAQVFDESVLGLIPGIVLGDKAREKGKEALFGFAGEHDRLGEHAVALLMGSDGEFAGGGDGSTGAGAVGL
jgi:hypothetical protein